MLHQFNITRSVFQFYFYFQLLFIQFDNKKERNSTKIPSCLFSGLYLPPIFYFLFDFLPSEFHDLKNNSINFCENKTKNSL